MKGFHWLLTSYLVILFSGCSESANIADEFAKVAPQKQMVELNIPKEDEVKKNEGDLAELYLQTVQTTRKVNNAVLFWLSLVENIIQFPPSSEDDSSALWGPWKPDGALSSAEYTFSITLNEDDSFDYAMSIRAADSDDAFLDIYTGQIAAQSSLVLNTGTMFFDYDAAASVDLAVTQRGTLSIEYDYQNGQKDIFIVFDQFRENQDDDPVNANYHYYLAGAGSGYFDFETWSDIHAGNPDAAQYPNDEHWEFRSRWTDSGQGRTDIKVEGQDLDTQGYESFKISECWDESFLSVYKANFITPDNSSEVEEVQWGEQANCSAFPDFESPQLD
ncbi:MAG: hypothetical protein PF689_00255 [Deltaproteobacteria bacterium]|nr:hypothetical protein [Deltaproteobacteria bacterium]